MKIEDIAKLMKKSRREVETMLKRDDIIELDLTEEEGINSWTGEE